MALQNEAAESKFSGFYLTNVITKLTKGSRAGYLLVSFGIVAVPAFLFFILGFEYFPLLSLFNYAGVFLFFLLARWGSDLSVTNNELLVEKAESTNKKELENLVQKLMHLRYNPWWHVISGIAFLSIVVLGALLLNHPEWLMPSALIISFTAGVTIWLHGGAFYFWHKLSTRGIGKLCPVKPLDPDRMGGFKFVADYIVAWAIMEFIMVGYVIALLMIFTWEVKVTIGLVYSLPIIGTFVVILFSMYLFLVIKLQRVFVNAKQEITGKISSILAPVERVANSFSSSTKQTDMSEQVVAQINPYAQSILTLKVFIDEVRYMRDWPIDLPMILKVVGAVSIPFIVLAAQLSIQIMLGFTLP